MKTFEELRDSHQIEFYKPLCEEIQRYLEEKLLIVGKGQNTGQAVILAGGAGSGKSFAVNQMIGGQYKIFNPDDLKDSLIKMRDNIKKGNPNYPTAPSLIDFMKQIKNLDLRNPNDTGLLHMALKNLQVGGKSLDQRRMGAFFLDPSKKILPNVLFDATLKTIDQLLGDSEGWGILDFLKAADYKQENIHVVWILTDYRIALKQNITRDRVVPADILFKSHSGAAKTMQDIIFKDYMKLGIKGDISVIIGGKSTVEYKKGSTIERDGKVYTLNKDLVSPVIKDFKYFRVKKAGANEINAAALTAIHDYILRFAPTADSNVSKDMQKIIGAIGRDKESKKIHPTTAKALDIPLEHPAVRRVQP